MRWQQGRRSDNVEDRRGGGFVGGGLKIGGVGLLLILGIALLTGQNPLNLLNYIPQESPQYVPPPTSSTDPNAPQAYDEGKDFAARILGDTEDTWTEIFAQNNRTYTPPKLVLFTQMVESACGTSSAAVGPFYCPLDSQVYLDLTFFQELSDRFGASGDFAQAYVIAHEVGHHVQNLLGLSDQVRQLQEQSSPEQANALSVRLELQADCLAGVWGNHAATERQMLETGDIEEGMNAAAAVGDDRIQASAGRAVSPESWTHGSAEMRVSWFQRGLKSGDINSCDTFQSR
jgi:predicted metalloprotease